MIWRVQNLYWECCQESKPYTIALSIDLMSSWDNIICLTEYFKLTFCAASAFKIHWASILYHEVLIATDYHLRK